MTLGYLGATQITNGAVEEACATWSTALDVLEEGISSRRARQAAPDMRTLLSPYRRRKIPAITGLDTRAAAYLARIH